MEGIDPGLWPPGPWHPAQEIVRSWGLAFCAIAGTAADTVASTAALANMGWIFMELSDASFLLLKPATSRRLGWQHRGPRILERLPTKDKLRGVRINHNNFCVVRIAPKQLR